MGKLPCSELYGFSVLMHCFSVVEGTEKDHSKAEQ